MSTIAHKLLSSTGTIESVAAYNLDYARAGSAGLYSLENVTKDYSIADSISYKDTSKYASSYRMFFNSIGTKLYVTGSLDAGSAQYSTSNFSTSNISDRQEIDHNFIAVSSDGNYGYKLSFGYIETYSLSTAHDITSASLFRDSRVDLNTRYDVLAFRISEDGYYAFAYAEGGSSASDTGMLYVYKLSTPNDLTTIYYRNNYTFSYPGTFNIRSSYINPECSKLLILSAEINTRLISCDISLEGVTVVNSILADDVERDLGSAVAIALYDNVIVSKDLTSRTENTDLDGNIIDYSYRDRFRKYVDNNKHRNINGFTFDNHGGNVYTVSSSSDSIIQYTLDSEYAVDTGFVASSIYIGNKETVPTNISFDSSGTKLFITGNSGNDINEYTLTVPYKLSTAVFEGTFNPGDTTPTDCYRSSSAIFTCGLGSDRVKKFNTVSSTSIVGEDNSSDDTLTFGNPYSITFKPNGEKLFVAGNDYIASYNLSTSFDLSTATYESSLSITSNSYRSIRFSKDGLKLFVSDSSGIKNFILQK